MKTLLKGRLTYVTATFAVLYSLVGLVFGFGESDTNLNMLVTGLGLYGLRRAL